MTYITLRGRLGSRVVDRRRLPIRFIPSSLFHEDLRFGSSTNPQASVP